MTDPTKDVAPAIWWESLKAAPADVVEKAKELCTSGKLTELAYEGLDGVITLLDTAGGFLPPPVNAAASLVSGLCKCVQGVHLNNANLKNLRDRCLDLLDLLLHLGGFDGFISTSRSSSEPLKLPQVFANITHRFIALVKRVITHCENYTREGTMAAAGRFFLHSRNKQEHDELASELHVLTTEAIQRRMHEKIKAEIRKTRAPKAHQAQPGQGRQQVSPVQGGAQLFLSYRVSETGRREQGGDCTVPLLKSALESQGYSVFVGESDIEGEASWAQAIQVAITDCQVFIPVCSKTYGDTKWTLRELHAANEAKKEILALWHSGDYPPKPVSMSLTGVKRLPHGNQPLVEADFQSLVSHLVAAVKKAGCLPRNPPGPSNQALQGGPVQGGAQLFLSYRVPETGRKEQGGDCTVPQLKSALEAHGYSVFVGESDIEGGASWIQAIDMAITDCQLFIPVCSKTYGDTKWTLRELHAADEAKKEILPLWHSGDYPPSKVRLYLGNLQRLPRGNQPLVQADLQSLVSHLVAAIKKAGCLPRNLPGPSNQALQGPALDQGRRRT